ncbi:MAG: hypothetical protein ACRCX8_01815 [Sarcina sp.]
MEGLKGRLYLGEGYKENEKIRNTKELEEYLRSKIVTYPKGNDKRKLYERLLNNIDDIEAEITIANRAELRIISKDKILCRFIERFQPRSYVNTIYDFKSACKRVGEQRFGVRLIDNRLVSADLLKSRK